jgi:hypothetical protein
MKPIKIPKLTGAGVGPRPEVRPMSPEKAAYYAQDRLNQAERNKRVAGLVGNTQQVAGTRPGVKPTVTGAPDKNLPFVINNKPIPGMRPPGTATTGGPKPAPAVQLPVAGTRPVRPNQNPLYTGPGIKKMGMKKGGSVSSASKRADGCAVKGKTKGKMV